MTAASHRAQAPRRRARASRPDSTDRIARPPKVFQSRYGSVCRVCQQRYPVDTPISRVEGGYAHDYCAEQQQQKTLIDEGYTYAATPRPYRRGR